MNAGQSCGNSCISVVFESDMPGTHDVLPVHCWEKIIIVKHASKNHAKFTIKNYFSLGVQKWNIIWLLYCGTGSSTKIVSSQSLMHEYFWEENYLF